MSLEVQLVSPEKILFEGTATMVVARTVGGGELAFLTGHAPFIGALDIAQIKVVPETGNDVIVAVHGGFVEVSNDRVTILSDVAELAGQIDTSRAQRAQERAEQQLRENADDEDAKAALARAVLRQHVAAFVP